MAGQQEQTADEVHGARAAQLPSCELLHLALELLFPAEPLVVAAAAAVAAAALQLQAPSGPTSQYSPAPRARLPPPG